MTSNTLSSDTIEQLAAETIQVIDRMAAIPHCRDGRLDEFRTVCSDIKGHIRSGRLKVAVVGVIKSGKSTLINSLVKKEVVKRGAGAMTSITTRIRKGKKNRARIFLKSWDQINQTLEKNLGMFPHERPQERFDLRRSRDRESLTQVYQTLDTARPAAGEGLRPEAMIIRNALEGFEACSSEVQADEIQVSFTGNEFHRHKIYTADPARAFYVRDVCLELYGNTLDPEIEMADCQGADSTDPAQLAQVISYIQGANLILYCISSRTGLRQSDIGFLKTIRRLGLMGNVLFINNCDLSEHENIEDIKRIEKGILRELGYLIPDPRLFTFSALFNLFEGLGRLDKKSAGRLDMWNAEPAMADYCRENFSDFKAAYDRLLQEHRYQLLYANHLERIRITAQGLKQTCDLVCGLLKTDMQGQADAKARMAVVEENAKRLKVIVDNSIQGAVRGLTREVSDNLKKAFVKGRTNINTKLCDFITAAKMDVSPYRAGVKETGFKQILYLMFQDFNRQLDRFALEEIGPELTQLVTVQERRIEEYFQALLDSYQIEMPALESPMEKEMDLSLQQPVDAASNMKAVNIKAVKQILGLSAPPPVFSARYNSRMRAKALTDFGMYSIVLFISALMDRHVRFSFTPGLNKAAQKIKKHSLAMVRQQVQAYHTALEKQYFIPLIEAVTRDFNETILNRFSRYDSLGRDLDGIFRMKQEEKLAQLKSLDEARGRIHAILNGLDGLALIPAGPDP